MKNSRIKFAEAKHAPYLKKNDSHVSAARVKNKINESEIIVIEHEGSTAGWLRFGYFWDQIPFMNMLKIEAPLRNKGLGRELTQFWEKEMKKQGHSKVMTSTLSNEEAQHFYRKMGYRDAGSLLLKGEALEIIFIKYI